MNGVNALEALGVIGGVISVSICIIGWLYEYHRYKKRKKPDSRIEFKQNFGLTTSSEVEKAIHQARRKAELGMAEKLVAFHKEYEKEQRALEETFSYDKIDQININFWDDFCDDGYVPEGEVTETYAYIEDNRLPDLECFNVLSKLLQYIKSNELLPSTVHLRMHFSDSTAKYPNLIHEHKYMLTKRWEIQITNISHRQLEVLIKRLKGYSQVTKLDIYSES